MPDQVPRAVVQERYDRLAALSRRSPRKRTRSRTAPWWRSSSPRGRAARTPRRTACPAGPATTAWCTSPARHEPSPGDVVTTRVTSPAPHLPARGRCPAKRPPHPRGRRWRPASSPPSTRRRPLPRPAPGPPSGPARHACPPRLTPARDMTLIAVVGPTAAGKSDLAVDLALRARRRGRSTPTRCSSTGAWTSAPPS